MKRHRQAVLAILAAGAASAHALSLTEIASARSDGTLKEVVIFGSSAQTPLVGAYMKQVVCAGAGDYDEFWNDAAGQDFRAWSCTMPTAYGYPAGTQLLVIKRDKDGSVYGVNQVARQTAGQSMVVGPLACSAFNHATTPAATCGTTAARTPVAGISDVEPPMFAIRVKVGSLADQYLNQPDPLSEDDVGNPWTVPTAAQLNSLETATLGQTIYGVAVTKTLRNALQAAQGLGVNSEAAADTPSLGKTFVTSALSGFVRGGPVANFANWSAVTRVAADNTKNIVICRQTRGSGPQAVSNAFFLEVGPLRDTAEGMLAPKASGVPANTDGKPVPGLIVNEGATVADTENCLHGTHAADFALGVLPRTKDPLLNGRSYRFVRLDGALPNQSNARTGRYEMVYASTLQWSRSNEPDPQTKSFLLAMRFQAAQSPHIALYPAEVRGGLLAIPRKWQNTTDTCTGATDPDDARYGSCVERVDSRDNPYNAGTHVYDTDAVIKTTSAGSLHLVR